MPEAPPPGGSGDIGPMDAYVEAHDVRPYVFPVAGRKSGAYSSSSLRTAIKASVGI